LGFTATARAQSYNSSVRIDQMQPASAGSPFARAEGPHDRFTEGVSYAFRVVGDYGYRPLRTRLVGGSPNVAGETSDKFPVEHAVLVHVGAQLSPLYWLNFELNMPFAAFETGTADDSTKGQPVPAGKPGVGDLRIGAHARPVSTKAFDLQLGARIWAPSGMTASYLTGQKKLFRLEAVIAASGEADFFLYGCTLGIAPMWFAGRDGDRLAASCAAGFRLAPFVQAALEPHFAAFTYAPDALDPLGGLKNASFALQFEPMGSLTFHVGDFWIGLVGGGGIGGAPGTPIARALLSLTYATRGKRVVEEEARDSDLDGIADGYDACPKEAGPKERRGCPEKQDSDGDGVIEGDACPDQPGAHYEDPKANGCPDRDNDHIADPIDQCPTEPGQAPEGCPKFARLKGKEFVVTPPIVFPAGSDRLGENETAALIEIVRTVRANPKIAHLAFRLGTQGTAARLTDSRAKTMLSVLSDQNLGSSRFELVLADDLAGGLVKVVITR
jgi:hypothetical protein